MKVIFLDHQGIMYIKKHPNPGTLDFFDKNTIQELNSILELDPSIEIVVSSDWKYWVPLEKMQEFYLQQGIKKAPIAYTCKTINYIWNIYAEYRSAEIKQFLLDSTIPITHWVAVDDIDMRNHLTNFVWVQDTTLGILQEGVRGSIIEHLGTQILPLA